MFHTCTYEHAGSSVNSNATSCIYETKYILNYLIQVYWIPNLIYKIVIYYEIMLMKLIYKL